MYRIVVIPFPTNSLSDEDMAHLAGNTGRPNAQGRYTYAWQTLREAREIGMQVSRNYNSGCSIFILDDEAGVIVDEARHPKRPQLTWKNMQIPAQTGKAATSKPAAKRTKV